MNHVPRYDPHMTMTTRNQGDEKSMGSSFRYS
jgi:hypothetical protein